VSNSTSKLRHTVSSEKMCYPTTTINLPPRYVKHIDSDRKTETTKTSRLTPCHGNKVQFRLDSNQVYTLPTHSSRSTWYSAKDYADFATAWKILRRHHLKAIRRKDRQGFDLMEMAIGRREKESIPTMEELRMTQTSVCRKNVVQSILIHQVQCRANGFNDPEGYALLSRALSKADKKLAWQLAAVNAYEVQKLFAEQILLPQPQPSHSTSNMSGLLADYYFDSVHPFLSQPLVFMSKLLLCECD
jgi:hypothetical protein